MAIYTKTGDTGTTATFGGNRVQKYDPQIEACGALDEATSFLGMVISVIKKEQDIKLLSDIQEDLYMVMGYIAGAPVQGKTLIDRIKHVETIIDTLEKQLPKLTRFILPQGTEITSRIHVARAITRSAERRVVAYIALNKTHTEDDSVVLQYLNRLSDLLFMFARKYAETDILT